MKIGLAQINTTVGDLPGNFEKILAAYRQAVEAGAELVLAPELAVTGYPPQDLLFKSRFVPASLEILQRLQGEVGAAPLLVGFVAPHEQGQPGQFFYNAAAFLQAGQPPQVIYKSLLPTYDVFDEARYFNAATRTAPILWNGRRLASRSARTSGPSPTCPGHSTPSTPSRASSRRGPRSSSTSAPRPSSAASPAVVSR